MLMLFDARRRGGLCGLLGVETAGELGHSAMCEIGNILSASYVRALRRHDRPELEPSRPMVYRHARRHRRLRARADRGGPTSRCCWTRACASRARLQRSRSCCCRRPRASASCCPPRGGRLTPWPSDDHGWASSPPRADPGDGARRDRPGVLHRARADRHPRGRRRARARHAAADTGGRDGHAGEVRRHRGARADRRMAARRRAADAPRGRAGGRRPDARRGRRRLDVGARNEAAAARRCRAPACASWPPRPAGRGAHAAGARRRVLGDRQGGRRAARVPVAARPARERGRRWATG